MVPVWLPHYEREYGAVTVELRNNLLRISARTLDRLMTPVRRRHGIRGRCGTRPGSLLKNQIPIKTEHADVNESGVLEADTVAHCGNSLDGNFIWSLTLTDIYSGWTENRAVWNKGYDGVRSAIANVEERLPFRLSGFHSDNGGEFLNHHLIRFFQERQLPIDYSRGRPYHKNDTAHVEQKNYTHVRLLLGYDRLDHPGLLQPISTSQSPREGVDPSGTPDTPAKLKSINICATTNCQFSAASAVAVRGGISAPGGRTHRRNRQK